jgi:signal transduction histidine kinase
VENSIAGWVVTHRQPVMISDAQKDPRHYRLVPEATEIITNSLLGVPLIAKDKVIGVLEAINKSAGDFTLEDQDLLMALSAQAAVAIENAHLFQQSDQISELIHELRTPLTSINMSARLLLNPGFPESSRQEVLEMILGETRRLSDLTADFLDLSRLETGRVQYLFQDFNPLPLLKTCIQLVTPQAEEAGISLILEAQEGLPPVRADYDKMMQVIINLLSNAIKYNRPGGKVILGAGISQDEIELMIQDTGFGIPQDSMPHLFEKFYRVPGNEENVSGTGLGLSICKRIIEHHAGQIQVDSQVDVGTTFKIRLPVQRILSTHEYS